MLVEKMFRFEEISRAAEGNWFALYEDLGIDTRKPNKGGQCPVCGGDDRAHYKKDGALYCRNCHLLHPNQLIMAVMGWDFRTYCDRMGNMLGLSHNSEPIPKGKNGVPGLTIKKAQKYKDRYMNFCDEYGDLITLWHDGKWLDDKEPSLGTYAGSGDVIAIDEVIHEELKKAGIESRFYGSADRAILAFCSKAGLAVMGVSVGDISSFAYSAAAGADIVTIHKGVIKIIENDEAKEIMRRKRNENHI